MKIGFAFPHTSEALLNEALRCEQIAKDAGRSGDFFSCALYRRNAEACLDEAAQLEKEGN